MVSKVDMERVDKDVAKYLNDFQFGVRVLGGANANFHNANKMLIKWNGGGFLAMFSV